jgi:hypothetical protein
MDLGIICQTVPSVRTRVLNVQTRASVPTVDVLFSLGLEQKRVSLVSFDSDLPQTRHLGKITIVALLSLRLLSPHVSLRRPRVSLAVLSTRHRYWGGLTGRS